MIFLNDLPEIIELSNGARAVHRKGVAEKHQKEKGLTRVDNVEVCPRCGSGREEIDKGVCKAILPDGKRCFMKW